MFKYMFKLCKACIPNSVHTKIRVLTWILKIGVKMLFARKKMEFYNNFLLAHLKKLGVSIKKLE